MTNYPIPERYARNPGHDGDVSPFPSFRFSVPQFLEIIELESLGEERFELIQGWLVPTEYKSPLHATVLEICHADLRQLAGERWMVRSQCSLQTSDSILEPDISIVKASYRPNSTRRYPTGAEVLLVVEFADRTLNRDRRKASLYAAAGVPVCWIVNIPERCVEVHDQPDDSMTYSRLRQFRGSEKWLIELEQERIGWMSTDQIFHDCPADFSPTDPR